MPLVSLWSATVEITVRHMKWCIVVHFSQLENWFDKSDVHFRTWFEAPLAEFSNKRILQIIFQNLILWPFKLETVQYAVVSF